MTATSSRGTDEMTNWRNVPAYPWRDDPDLQAAHPTPPLEIGARVAWACKSYGMTNGLSGMHRVGSIESEPHEYDGHTFCGGPIPLASCRVVATLRSVDVCLECEIAAAK